VNRNEDGHIAFARLVSSAVVSQVLISATSFAIGLILIRWTSASEYAYYILATNAILLATSLQNAFFNPPLANRFSTLGATGRADLVGGMYREQRRIVPVVAAAAACATLVLWLAGVVEGAIAALVLATIVAACAVLNREYFRMVLFAHRRPVEVLRADVAFVALIVIGVYVATRTTVASTVAVSGLCVAALVSGVLLARALRRIEPWNIAGVPTLLRDIAPLGAWSVTGAAVHWGFSQGYMYIVAATLDVRAVAAIAATRLLLMPVNLMTSGMMPLMLPLTSRWLHHHGRTGARRRLAQLGCALALGTVSYFAILWFLRDWIFAAVLKKHFDHADALLIVWGLTFLVAAVRSQFGYLIAAESRFRYLTSLTTGSAAIALTASYLGMVEFGVIGAVVGVLLGELIYAIGVAVCLLRSRVAESPATTDGVAATTQRSLAYGDADATAYDRRIARGDARVG
jgi:O-antigen/teichoic acid export membrane protein